LWIHDDTRHTDAAYNWGVFDFRQPRFLQRFLTGDTRYWLAVEDAHEMIERYAAANRTVWVQELDLTLRQRAQFRAFVDWNAQPENRFYRYDYYRDNCSTRARDALDRVLGGTIRRQTAGHGTRWSYHAETARLFAYDPIVYAGITLALGEPSERALSRWEDMFIPMRMMLHLRAVRLPDTAGVLRPLVKSEWTVFRAQRPPEPATVPRYTPYYLLVGVVVAGMIAALGHAAATAAGSARTAWLAVVEVWNAVTGIIGALLFVVYGTRHVYMTRNENMYQFELLSLVLTLLLPIALRHPRTAGAARAAAWAVAALALLGTLLKAVPVFDQRNWELIALALPVHLAVAWTVTVITRSEPRIPGRAPAPPMDPLAA
jgi:hypothetical protein